MVKEIANKQIYYGTVAFILVVAFLIVFPFLTALTLAAVLAYLFFPVFSFLNKYLGKYGSKGGPIAISRTEEMGTIADSFFVSLPSVTTTPTPSLTAIPVPTATSTATPSPTH